jgi:hypothetical protein
MVLKSKEETIRKKVDDYLSVVKEAGFCAAKQTGFSDELKSKLEMPLLPINEYIKYIGG